MSQGSKDWDLASIGEGPEGPSETVERAARNNSDLAISWPLQQGHLSLPSSPNRVCVVGFSGLIPVWKSECCR